MPYGVRRGGDTRVVAIAVLTRDLRDQRAVPAPSVLETRLERAVVTGPSRSHADPPPIAPTFDLNVDAGAANGGVTGIDHAARHEMFRQLEADRSCVGDLFARRRSGR